jgi:hypothetical protein
LSFTRMAKSKKSAFMWIMASWRNRSGNGENRWERRTPMTQR